MANRIKGITVEIGGDTTGLNKALQGVQSTIKNTQSSLRDVNKLLKLDPTNTELLNQKQKLLKESIGATKDKLETLKTAQQQAKKEFDNGNLGQDKYDALQREIVETEQELKKLQTEASKTNKSLEKIGEVGSKLEKAGGSIKGAGKKMMGVTTAVGAMGAAAVKTTADFDSSMSKVAAVSGATGKDLEALENKAREMGASTKYSASEAAEALNYMAMAGWKTNDMLGGIEGVMHLAAASGEELGTTSDIVTDALTALGMAAEESGHFADILAVASSNANTNVALLGESFQYCAPVAGAMGASAEDLSIALGLMANSGIKGSQAGNSLKNALVNLVKPTKAQATAMENLGLMTTETTRVFDNDAIEKAQTKVENKTLDLQKAQISYNDAVDKYGESSSQAQKALINIEKAENNLAEAQKLLNKEQQGTIKSLGTGKSAFVDAQGNMKSLGEIMNILRSSLGAVNVDLVDSEGNLREYDDIIKELSQTEEGLTQAEQLKNAGIIFGKQNLSGMLAIINATESDYNKLTDAIYSCDGTAKNMAETMQDNLEGQLTILKSQLQELAISFGKILMPAIRKIVGKVQEFVDKLNGMDDGTKKTIAKIALFVAAIGPLLFVIGSITSKTGKAIRAFSSFAKGVSALSTKVGGLSGLMGKVGAAISGISLPIVAIVAVIAILVAAFKHLWDTNEKFRSAIIGIWEGIVSKFKAFTQGITDRINALGFDFENFSQVISAIWNSLCEFLAPVFEGVFTYIANMLEEIFGIITGILDIFIGVFTGDWSQVWEGVKGIFLSIWNFVVNSFKNIMNVLKGVANVVLGWFGTSWNEVWTGIKDFFVNLWTGIVNFFTGVWEGIKNTVQTAIMFIGAILQAAFDIITLPFRFIWENCKDTIISIWEKIKSVVSTAINAVWSVISPVLNKIKSIFTTVWSAIKSIVANAVNGIKSVISTIFNAVKTFVANVWEKIKAVIVTPINIIKNTVSNVFNAVKNTVTNIFNSIKEKTTNIWNGIKSAICTPIEKARDIIKGIIDKIKGFFSGMKLSLPKIKLPHFSVTGKLSLNPPSVPHLNIDWYKDGGIMAKPTIFGMNGSSLMAGGEAGKEAILPLSGFYKQLSAMLDNKINMSRMEKYLAIIANNSDKNIYLNDNVLVGKLSPAIDKKLGSFASLKARGN